MTGSSDVEDLFDEFLAQLEEGAAEDFEGFAARHPEQAEALTALYARWSRLEAQLESALPEALVDESFFHGTEPGQGLGAESSVPPPAEAGTIVADDYRLLRLIGQGGMGHVWEAEQLSIGRRVALKLVRPGRGDPSDPASMAREARAGGRLNHPGIVTVYAAGVADGVHYIAQELVGDGFTLADFIERRRHEPLADARAYRKLAGLFAQVAEAVHSAHEANILHRDLKPSNILIGDDDRPRVSDFGLAHLAEGDEPSARPGLLGTWAYMSPEQAVGRDIAIDRRSDVFSLGAVFYEALTLRRAFDGDTGEQIVEQLVSVDPPDPCSLRSRIPRDLAVICRTALAKNRGDRYASMAALAADLRRFLADEPIEARPQGLLTRALLWSRRHPAWTTGLVLVSLALLIISSLLLNEVVLRREAEHSNRLAEERADEALRQSYLAAVRSAVMNLAQGRHAEARAMLDSCVEDQRGWEWRHYALAADLSLLHLHGHHGPVRGVAVDANGRRLLTGSEDGTLRLWDGDSGATLAVLEALGAPVIAVALSADGATIVGADDTGEVLVWRGLEPRPSTSLQAAGSPVVTLSASADGRLVAGADEAGGVILWDLSSGARHLLPPDSSAWRLSMQLAADGSRLVCGSRYGQILYYGIAADGLSLISNWWLQDSVLSDVSVGLSADGARILAGLVDGTVLSWNGSHGGDVVYDREAQTRVLLEQPLLELRRGGGETPTLGLWPPLGAISTDPGRPLAEGPSMTLQIDADGRLAVTTPEPDLDVLSLRGHAGPVNAVVLAGDGRRLVSASSEGGALIVWDVPGEAAVIRLTGQQGPIHALAMAADGSRILAGCGDHDALVWMGDTLGATVALPALDEAPNALVLSDDGSLLASASIRERLARVWDGRNGRLLATLPGHPLSVTALAMDASGSIVVTGSYDRQVRLWNGASGEPRGLLVGHGSGITSVAIDDAGTTVVSGSHDKTVRLWDTASARCRQTLQGSRSPITSVAMDGAGLTVAAGSEDGTVRLWSAPFDGDPQLLRQGSWADDGAVSLSRDGTRLAWASARHDLVLVWDTASGAEVARLTGTRSHVVAATLSDDGRWLLWSSAGDDGARLLHVQSGEVRAVLSGHGGPVTALAFGEGSGRILTADRSGTIRIWESERARAQALWSGLAATR